MRLLSALWPRTCLLCHEPSEDVLCPACGKDLPRRKKKCPHCARSNSSGQICRMCRLFPPAFSETLSAWQYRFPVDSLIHDFKYRANLSLASYFADALLLLPLPIAHIDGLVPIPLHTNRLAERGFNQSQEIARALSDKTGIALMDQLLVRKINTPSQTGLNFRARRLNLINAFICNGTAQGLRLALVDDVMTSGATMRECARALKIAGAHRISCWVAARVGATD